VGFEPTIAVLERAKIVRALDRSATAIGSGNIKKKMFLGNKVRLVRGADNLTAINESIV
jgi:hypothetical protein